MNLKMCVINSCFILLKLVTSKKEKHGIAFLGSMPRKRESCIGGNKLKNRGKK